MSSIRIIFVACLLWSVQVLAAVDMRLMTQHPSHPSDPDSIWLKEYRMMRIEAEGPGHMVLGFRQVLVPDRVAGPVDLTIVRDDEEQGTIRFNTPGTEGEFSGPVTVLIDVPVGAHTYRLLVSGPEQGVVVKFVRGKVDTDTNVIELTASLEKKQGLKLGMLDEVETKKKPKKKNKPVLRSKTDIIGSVAAPRAGSASPQTSLLYANPDVPTTTVGPWTMASGGMMFLFLISSASLAASAGVQSQRARHNRSDAEELLGRADRANKAAIVMAGAAGVALITSVVMYLIENSDEPAQIPAHKPAGLSIRF